VEEVTRAYSLKRKKTKEKGAYAPFNLTSYITNLIGRL
jgi:hypothetical protein